MKMEVKKMNSLKSKKSEGNSPVVSREDSQNNSQDPLVWRKLLSDCNFLFSVTNGLLLWLGFLSKRLWASTTTESESNGENVKFRKELGTTKDDLQLA
ncbi:hypothetical protein C5167_024966 [Papaver somniferum]|uniref:Uncharacterized protein n=1 Tax=Papaver somniferum TaxID=3469 RepID=A0A4Y7JR91_PAPSO|nr:hypothetical protein C5167_024966 [Papaver somniferum]